MRAAQRRQISLVFGWSSMFGSLAFASAGTKQGNSYAARRFRLAARNQARRLPARPGRHPVITRRGNDWTQRYPLVVEAVNHLKVRSCLIDGEVVCCDAQGVTSFQLLRHRRNEAQAFL